MSNNDNLFDLYFAYAKETSGKSEVPDIFHRWACITSLGAWLGRRFQFQHGHMLLNPNVYTLLIGPAGTKKSTAIKIFKNVLKSSGYTTFAAEKTSKEKFLVDLVNEGDDIEDILEQNIFGNDPNLAEPSECFIASDEFTDFFGNNILEFVALLGVLWDYNGNYENKVKNSKSVIIANPTINILGGTTPTTFNNTFPAEIIGQGFFSRILLIYGETTGERITFPRTPTAAETAAITQALQFIRGAASGIMAITPDASKLLDKIYRGWKGIDDIRFDSYANRRFTHLLKLCLIHTAAFFSNTLTEEIVIYTNTVLSYVEHFMPKALGEFGKAKHADVSHKIIQLVEKEIRPVSIDEIWKHVNMDLDKFIDLGMIILNLERAGKLQKTQLGILPNRKRLVSTDANVVDWKLLSKQEQERIGKL